MKERLSSALNYLGDLFEKKSFQKKAVRLLLIISFIFGCIYGFIFEFDELKLDDTEICYISEPIFDMYYGFSESDKEAFMPLYHMYGDNITVEYVSPIQVKVYMSTSLTTLTYNFMDEYYPEVVVSNNYLLGVLIIFIWSIITFLLPTCLIILAYRAIASLCSNSFGSFWHDFKQAVFNDNLKQIEQFDEDNEFDDDTLDSDDLDGDDSENDKKSPNQ